MVFFLLWLAGLDEFVDIPDKGRNPADAHHYIRNDAYGFVVAHVEKVLNYDRRNRDDHTSVELLTVH
jgi:hypothetical protein